MPYKDKTEHAEALKRYRQKKRQAVEEAKKVLLDTAKLIRSAQKPIDRTGNDFLYDCLSGNDLFDAAFVCEEAARQLSPTQR